MVRIPWFNETAIWVKVTLAEEGKMEIACATLKNVKNNVVLTEEKNFDTIKALASRWAGLPVVVQIEGRGCLTKKVSRDDDGLFGEDIIQRVLPNANSQEFGFQVFVSEKESTSIASIIRIAVLDEVLQQFLENGLAIKRLIIGNLVDHIVSTNENTIPLKRLSGQNRIIPEWINHLSAIENGTYWALSKVNSSAMSLHDKEMKFFRWTKKVLIICPIVLLISLIGNMLWYDHLESRYVASEAKIESSRSELDSIALLEGMLSEQARVLGSEKGFSSIPASYYSDRIGQSITPGITLSKLDIFPMMINTESGKVEKLKYDTIMATGLSNNSSALNNWVARINKLPWITGVNILDYNQTNTNEDGHFELLITCN